MKKSKHSKACDQAMRSWITCAPKDDFSLDKKWKEARKKCQSCMDSGWDK